FQILFGVLRLGFLTTYLSDPLVSGFTTGSAAHVMVSQLNKVIGVKLPRHEGAGMLVWMVRDLILSIPSTNLAALLISVVGILFLDLGRTYLNPRVKRFSPVPPPLELILVIIGVILSITLGLKENYGVAIVNTIPRGFPAPSLPNTSLVPHLISDGVAIAVICYMFVMSMGKLFAKKHKY
ncbi:unnamed protein product, partial [Nippostrongylus brasiliensis]|uniref:Sulfate_transp domain-containing protein n=1 Tax=Nippostrongylus brasiliensis TaxID=27835 RepID=A0A0N4XPG0_NIPBR